MMKTHMTRVRRVAGPILAGGFVVASGCTVSDVQTVLAGINAVANVISSTTEQDDDISFGDWLADEFGN